MANRGRFGVVVVACALLLGGCSFWGQVAFGPDHTGSNPLETTLTPANVGSLTMKWRATTADGLAQASPAVVGNSAFVGPRAFNATTGALLWTSGGDVPYSAAFAGGLVYDVGYALHSSLVVANDATTGALVWFSTGSGNQDFYSTPTVDTALANGVVYVGKTDGHVLALNAATGAVLWNTAISGGGSWQPTVLGDVVYVGTGANMSALSAATGAIMWTTATAGQVNSTAAVAGGVVYVATAGPPSGTAPFITPGAMYAFNAATGAVLWTAATSGLADGENSAPAVAGGVVYVGSYDHNVYAVNAATGAILWTTPTGGVVDASPAVANGVVYIHSEDGKLYAMNAATGAVLWNATVGGGFMAPAVTNGVVYVNGYNGLYAFGLPAGP